MENKIDDISEDKLNIPSKEYKQIVEKKYDLVEEGDINEKEKEIMNNFPKRKKLYLKLFHNNGKIYQLKVFISELYELMREVSKSSINSKGMKDQITDELVDTFICMEQFFIYTFGLKSNIPTFKEVFKNESDPSELNRVSFLVNKYFIKIIDIINDYQNEMIMSGDVFDNLNINNKESYPSFISDEDHFKSLYKKFISIIIYILKTNENYSYKSLIIHFNYKISRLEDRLERQTHL